MLNLFHPPLIIINGIYNEYEQIVKPVIIDTLAGELAGLKTPVPQVVFGNPVELKASVGAAMLAAEVFLEKYLNSKIVKTKLLK